MSSILAPSSLHSQRLCRWLHILSERCKAWRNWHQKDIDVDDLPQRFRDVQGDSDPPLSSYARCVEVVDMLENVLPPDMYRTLTGLMFSILMDQEEEPRDVPSPAKRSPVASTLPAFEDEASGKNGYYNALC